jgi:hypothetical protein
MGRHEKTLAAIFAHPVAGNIRWREIEALLRALGADVEERAGSRVAIVLNGQVEPAFLTNLLLRRHICPRLLRCARSACSTY